MSDQVNKQLNSKSKVDEPMDIYGSSDGWLNIRGEDGFEYYLVPNATFHRLGKVIKQSDVPKTWMHLGAYQMVEAK